MTEKEKMTNGLEYQADDSELVAELNKVKDLCMEYNSLRPTCLKERNILLKRILGKADDDTFINQPFYCDYGKHIKVGKKFFANFNFTVLDEAYVTIGDNCFVGPSVSIYTACHSTDPNERNSRREWAEPVTIGNNCWIGGNVTILPGVTIGDNVTIGAGSVVTKDIPSCCVAVGNPAKPIKKVKAAKQASAVVLMLLLLVLSPIVGFTQRTRIIPRMNVPLDSIRLSDPFVLADSATMTYYMTGTGGMMWESKDLKFWNGPYKVTETDTASWMGKHPMIWAAELHKYKGKYYYFATFTNQEVFIDTVKGRKIERRASHILVSDKAAGPYRPVGKENYLPEDKPTLDGTFWIDTDGKPYMVYCWEWLQNLDGTIDKIELKSDLSGSIGEGKTLFRASDSPWSRERDEDGNIKPNMVTDGPFLFRTTNGRLGMLWTSWIFDVYTQGVAYSESGTLDGPWLQEPEPITPPNYGHGMIFRTFDGRLLLSCHSHRIDEKGRTVRIPKFFEVSLDGDRCSLR